MTESEKIQKIYDVVADIDLETFCFNDPENNYEQFVKVLKPLNKKLTEILEDHA